MIKYVLTVLLLCITACARPEVVESTLNIAVPIEMLELNPYLVLDIPSVRIRNQVYESLLTMDSNGNLQPSLAIKWEYLNPTTIEFTLRSNVSFHNGETLHADDVVFSLNQSLSTPTHQTALRLMKSIKAIDPLTVRLELKTPYAAILLLLSDTLTYILNQKAAEEGNYYVGTGAFQFKEWNKGQNIILERFDNYWGGKANVPMINIRTVPESLVRMVATETAEVDIAYDIDYIEKQRALEKGLVFAETLTPRIEYLGFNVSKYPYNNPKLREAIAYALDIPGIINSAVLGAGKQATILYPQGAKNALTPPIVQDIKKAQKSFDESGLPKGIEIKLLALDGVKRNIAEIIQANLKEIGIEVTIEVVEWSKFVQMLYAHTTDMYLGSWSASADPDLFYYLLLHSNAVGGNGNNFAYKNPQMDNLLELAQVESDPIKRQGFYDEVDKIIDKDKMLIPLYYPLDTLVHRNTISKVRFDEFRLQLWKEVGKDTAQN